MKECKWLHSDWCHKQLDPMDCQDKCNFYFNNKDCPECELIDKSKDVKEVSYAEFDEKLTIETAEKYRKLLEAIGRL